MALLTLDLGCGDYDIVRPLKDGAVRAEGLEINFITINRPPEVHWRMGMHQEFDAAEMSFGSFVAGKARRRLSVRRHSGICLSKVPPLLRLRQRQRRHR